MQRFRKKVKKFFFQLS